MALPKRTVPSFETAYAYHRVSTSEQGRSGLGLAAQAEGVRDALYELYCDAADERLRAWTGPGAPFEAQVRGSYGWCASVVTMVSINWRMSIRSGSNWRRPSRVRLRIAEISRSILPILWRRSERCRRPRR